MDQNQLRYLNLLEIMVEQIAKITNYIVNAQQLTNENREYTNRQANHRRLRQVDIRIIRRGRYTGRRQV